MSTADSVPRASAGALRARLTSAPAWPLTAALAVVYLLLSPQSPDLAAASYRSHLFATEGLTLWDNSWYGGHHLLAYSLLAPALGALIGPALLAALSMVAATALFELTLADRVPERSARLASVWFAIGASVALLSSRVPFDLGLAVALGSVVTAQRSRWTAAGTLAVLASAASPVAGAFLGMAMLAWALACRRRAPLALRLLALSPIALLTLVFPEGGSQPFVASAFWPALAGVILVGIAIPAEQRVLRTGVLLYALVLIGSFLVPSAVGGNADRLGALAAGPIAAIALAAADGRRRLLLVALVAPLTYWQANAPITDYVSTVGNRATQSAFYAPLLDELRRLGIGYGGVPARIEVVPTVDHWEARYVAPAVMIARGWERQLDRYRNGLFYSSKPLTSSHYSEWLAAQSVSYVALPDASLDYSGKAEARVIKEPGTTAAAGGFLREIWRSEHWRLYAVRGVSPLVEAVPSHEGLSPQATARLLQVGRDSFRLLAPQPGRYEVRLRFTPYWAVTSGEGCVGEARDGWTWVHAKRPGTMRVAIRFSLARIFSRGERCN